MSAVELKSVVCRILEVGSLGVGSAVISGLMLYLRWFYVIELIV